MQIEFTKESHEIYKLPPHIIGKKVEEFRRILAYNAQNYTSGQKEFHA